MEGWYTTQTDPFQRWTWRRCSVVFEGLCNERNCRIGRHYRAHRPEQQHRAKCRWYESYCNRSVSVDSRTKDHRAINVRQWSASSWTTWSRAFGRVLKKCLHHSSFYLIDLSLSFFLPFSFRSNEQNTKKNKRNVKLFAWLTDLRISTRFLPFCSSSWKFSFQSSTYIKKVEVWNNSSPRLRIDWITKMHEQVQRCYYFKSNRWWAFLSFQNHSDVWKTISLLHRHFITAS